MQLNEQFEKEMATTPLFSLFLKQKENVGERRTSHQFDFELN